MAKYFTVEELCRSTRAKQLNINNTPSEEITEHLKELIEFIDPIREKWGSAIRVTSGYRCPQLNKAVGGVSTSAHLFGYAVDLVPKKGTPVELFEFIKGYLVSNKLCWDQLIIEKSSTGSWVHFGLKSKSGKQRMQMFRLDV